MPHEIIGEAVAGVASDAAELAGDKIHKRYGWKGCLVATVMVGGLIGAGLYLLYS